MKLVGANPRAKLQGLEQLPGISNYFIGDEPRKWRTNIRTYRGVAYSNVYPDIDLTFYGSQGDLEYDFRAGPGANLADIKLKILGARRMAIDTDGALQVATDAGELRFRKPVAFQPVARKRNAGASGIENARREPVDAHYVLLSGHEIAFQVASYDKARRLVIDPVVTFSTYLGGKGADTASGVAVDSSGEVFIIGNTFSQNFPTTPGAYDTSPALQGNVFVTKLNSQGTALVYSTYFGNNDNGSIFGNAIALDSAGNAYITGLNQSTTGLPVTAGAVQTGQPLNSAFVAKLNPTGSALVYSGFLGTNSSTGLNQGRGIAVDASGNVYLAGETQSSDFPVTPSAFQNFYAGGSPVCTNETHCGDAFFAEIDPSGSTILYASYLGGSAGEVGIGIALDAADKAYITGITTSINFPTTEGAFSRTYGGGVCGGQPCGDAFVAKFDPTQSGPASLVYSTYLGGNQNDKGIGIAADASGNAYVTGWTLSPNFPTTPGAFQTSCGTDGNCNGGFSDAFITKLNAAGTALIYSTFLGGENSDVASAIALDAGGNAYVTGDTLSSDFPTTPGAPQPALAGTNSNAFVTILSADGSSISFSTFWGGSGTDNSGDSGTGIAVDQSGNIYFGGTTASVDFPTTPAVFQPSFGGLTDAFVTEFSTLLGVTLSANSLNFMTQTVGTSSSPQNVTLMVSGSQNLAIGSISFTGPNSGDFSQTNTCGQAVSSGSSCTISVTFLPTVAGNRNAQLTIADNALDSPQTVALSGTGITPSGPGATVSPASLSFTNQLVGTGSAAQPITLTNSGDQLLTITGISTVGANSGDFSQMNNCGSSLSSGSSCTINVIFMPGAAGNRVTSLNILDNASGSPQMVALAGTGADFSLSVAGGGSSSATVTAGQTATYALQLASTNFTGSISLSCVDPASSSSCTPSPSPVMLSGTSAAAITVTVNTTARSQLLPPLEPPTLIPFLRKHPGFLSLVFLPLLVLILKSTKRCRTQALATLSVLFLAAILAGCGSSGGSSSGSGGGSTGGGGSNGTPAGSYTLTVTGTASGVSRSLALTLQVN